MQLLENSSVNAGTTQGSPCSFLVNLATEALKVVEDLTVSFRLNVPII